MNQKDSVKVRADGQSSLKSLKSDGTLLNLGIELEIGRSKNVNENAPVDKAIRELREVLKLSPKGGPISVITLAKATANLNNIIRFSERSSTELWTNRYSTTEEHLTITDDQLSDTVPSETEKS